MISNIFKYIYYESEIKVGILTLQKWCKFPIKNIITPKAREKELIYLICNRFSVINRSSEPLQCKQGVLRAGDIDIWSGAAVGY